MFRVLLAWVAWIGLASWPGGTAAALSDEAAGAGRTIEWSQEREFWAFQRPRGTVAPAVGLPAWVRQPIDAFILNRLERHGLTPSPPAARAAWLRRVSYDLIGLPPTAAEVHAFLQDTEMRAEERVVDRLLASPRMGERWASLWLPLARYAEDQAHQVGDDTKYFYPNAWRYRAWVIDAFNQDMPYDLFLQRQIAADLIDGTNSVHRAALGFLGLGPKYYNRDRLDVMADEWEDRVDTVTRGMLGLTVACARCHDHKFEPVTMRDYYALAGVFASTRMVNAKPDGAPEDEKADAKTMAEGTVHVVAEGERKPVHIFLRGQAERLGPEVERSFPQVLSLESDRAFPDGSGRRELARAIARAENPLVARVWVNRVWGALFGRPLVDSPSNFGHSGTPPTYPELLDDLAARFVEQGWSTKQLMRELVLSATYRQASGEGSLAAPVDTTDLPGRRDRGMNHWAALGSNSAPREQGSTRSTTKAEELDSANEWLWRMNRRRLSVEQWRDAALFVSGELDLSGGKSRELDDPTFRSRTVFARVSRLQLHDFLAAFDYPDANVHAEKRAETVTPLQKLFLLNGAFMEERARALAQRVTRAADAGSAASERIQWVYRELYGREADVAEVALGLAFLQKPAAGAMTRWEQYAQALLAANEMWYVD